MWLADALREMRDENDAQIKGTRDEAEALFQIKLSLLKAMQRTTCQSSLASSLR